MPIRAQGPVVPFRSVGHTPHGLLTSIKDRFLTSINNHFTTSGTTKHLSNAIGFTGPTLVP